MKHRLQAAFLVLVIVATSGYSYYQIAYSKCRVPIAYDIGTIDHRFTISHEEVRQAVSDAESLWEDATGKNLFTYREGADLVISFVYDERQETTEQGHALAEVLDRKAEMSASIKENYEAMLAGYEKLKVEHAAKVASYERRLAAHNALVEEWNQKGGAPRDIYQELENAATALNHESASLNESARTLNALVAKINEIGTRGNNAVNAYNADVERYNETFADGREFTQGHYDGDITIFQYDDLTELRKVLAHEMGHALGVDHVDDENAVMYYLMEGQLSDLTLTEADVEAYRAICGAT